MSERLTLPELPASVDAYEVVQNCRLSFLRRLNQALRESGAAEMGEAEAACLATGRFFDEAVAARRAGFEQADGLTASKISLVCDDQLELEIAVGDLSRRLGEAAATALRRVYLRFATLLQRAEFEPADLPVAPESVGHGVSEMLAAQGGGMARWQPLLERLEPALAEALLRAYQEIDELLANQGVEPAQIAGQPSAASRPREPVARPAGSGTGVATNPAAALQAALLRHHSAHLSAPGDVAATGANAAATVIPVELLNQLVARLEALEQSDSPVAPQSVAAALRAGPLGVAPERPEAATIDALALVFEAIFADPDLPEPVKTAIAGLQIPVLKAALADPGFFDSAEHPARRLLDRMATAAFGLPRDTHGDHPVCERLTEMAAYLRGHDDGSPAIFESSVAKVDSVIERRAEQARQSAAAYLPLVEDATRRRAAARKAREVLASLVSPDLPAPIAEFLLGQWALHLEKLLVSEGEASPAVGQALQVAHDLIWSVRLKESPEERRRLAQGVPALLRAIGEGLDGLGISQTERAPFLDACFALQTAAIRTTPESTDHTATDVGYAVPATLASEAVLPTLETCAAAGLTLQVLDLPGRTPDAQLLASPPWAPGEWIDLTLPDGQAVRGHLACLTPDGWPLFINPAWDHALTVSPLVLDRQLRSGEAARAEARSLFDAAATRALAGTAG